MKNLFTLLFLTFFTTTIFAQDPSAVVEFESQTQGMLIPRMLESERTAINLPANGLLVYQTDLAAGFYFNKGTTTSPDWVLIGQSSEPNRVIDADMNTRVEVENTTDENIIRFSTSGSQRGQIGADGRWGINTTNPQGLLSLGGNASGYSGDSIQLHLFGQFNTGVNQGSVDGTYKLLIEGYNNDGPVVYPLFIKDENDLTDFYVKGRATATSLPHIYLAGNTTIGTETMASGYRLSVGGKIACEEVFVDFMADWPDYVFEANYPLMDLADVKAHIQSKGHLPGIPSAKEVKTTGGLKLGEMNAKLLEKIEELTLYILEQEERLNEQEAAIKELSQR